MYLLESNAESCDEDDDEVGVGVVEELVDVVFDRWSSGRYTHDPHSASQEKELREFLQET